MENTKMKRLSCLVGNTPLLKITYRYKGNEYNVYAKAENFNMTGSIKDRMAYHILQKAYLLDLIKEDSLIVEATSGNTGISFTSIGRALGHPVTIFMPNWMSTERINLIRSMGATINLVSKDQGGFLGSIELAEKLADDNDNAFLPRQFSNIDNVEAHYTTTGPEIWFQLSLQSLKPDAFIAGVGTGGTIMGTGAYLRKKNPDIMVCPLEPTNSPTLSTGHKVGKHRIEGISDEFIPSILDLKSLDSIVGVDDGDAIIMAQKLASELGLGVGISSGANLIGAIMAQQKLGKDAVIVTVLPDDNKKYLSTDLLREEPVKPDFIAPEIELLEFNAFKRVCNTCCDPDYCVDLNWSEVAKLPYCPRRPNKK